MHRKCQAANKMPGLKAVMIKKKQEVKKLTHMK
jgi:hypothetical protein